MRGSRWFYFLTLILMLPISSRAGVTLLDKDDWKIAMSGFIEMDAVHDSTRSFGEVMGNSPVDRSGSYNAENGRTTFSNRNSRLAFAITAPSENDWKSRAYLEFDFLGYEPTVGSGTPTMSESGYYSASTVRLRHAYLAAENDDFTLMLGQTWSLFGWQPAYVPTTVSVSPGAGILFQRTAQALALKSFKSGEHIWTAGLAVARPSQRDAEMPNVDVGLKYAFAGRRSGMAGATSEASAEPMSVALSGTFRQFEVPQSATTPTGKNAYSTSAVAADAFIPLIAADDRDTSHTLTLTAEYALGSGYADGLPGWNGNLAMMPTGTGLSSKTNLDAGYGGFDGAGNFSLVRLQTWSAQLQYHFAKETRSFAGLGYAQLHSDNIGELTPSAAAGKTLYDTSSFYYVNYFKDFTAHLRLGLEYSHATTKYVDGDKPSNERYEVAGYFRF